MGERVGRSLGKVVTKGGLRGVHTFVRAWQILYRTWGIRSTLRRKGIYLECEQAQEDYVLRRWPDGSVFLQGRVQAREGVASVSVHCDGTEVAKAELTPEGPRGGRFLASLHRFVLRAPSVRFTCRLDTRRLPVESAGWTIIARSRDGHTCEAFLEVQQIAIRNRDERYERWRQAARPTSGDLFWMRRRVRHLDHQPTITLCTCVMRSQDLPRLRATLRSLKRQLYPGWELVIAAALEMHAPLLEEVPALREEGQRVRTVVLSPDHLAAGLPLHDSGEWVGPIDPGDVLEPDALLEVLREIERHPETDLLYSDEDAIGDDNGRRNPVFKPDWSPNLLLGTNYIGRLWLARASLVQAAGGRLRFTATAEYDLLLKLTEAARRIGHIRTVLYGKRHSWAEEPPPPAEDTGSALRDALRRRGIAGEVLPGPLPGTFRVRRTLQAPGMVSIIVFSKGRVGRAFLRSIRTATTYPDCEVIVVQCGTAKAETVRRLWGRPPCTVVSVPGPASHTALLNRGAALARGAYLLFVEEATVRTGDWVEALLEHAQRPEVAAVGGRVIDPQGYVYHAGLFLNNKGAGARRAFFAAREADPGPLGWAHLQRDCTAISSTCLMVRRAVFDELGGFDTGLDGLQGDVDFCLRAAQKGYRTIVTPHAVLCGKRNLFPDLWKREEESVAAYWDRWRHIHEQGDPYHNPNVCSTHDDYSLSEELTVIRHSPCPMIDANQIRKILIVKLDHLGDMLVSLPAIRRLAALFPGAEITALVGSWSKPLLEREACIARILCYDYFSASSATPHLRLSPAEQSRIADWLGSQEFDLAVDLRWDPETRVFLQMSDAPFTAGYAHRTAFPWLTLALPAAHPEPAELSRLHISQVLMQLVGGIEFACQPAGNAAENGSEAAQAGGDRLFLDSVLGGKGLVIGIHPGAGTAVKRWPPEAFARLADRCVERLGARIVLLGAAADGDLVQSVLQHMRHPERAFSLAGQMRFAELPGVLRRLDLYIGNDSGPGHLAASLGIPTLTLLASASQPVVWAPSGPSVVTVRRALACAPCHLTDLANCPHGHACMRSLSVDSAWEALLRALPPGGKFLPRTAPGQPFAA